MLRLTQATCLSGATDVHIINGATMDLAFTGTNTIRALYINGVMQEGGRYGSANQVGYLSGTGYLLIFSCDVCGC